MDYMNGRKWREAGYATIFMHGNVYLVDREKNEVYVTPVDKGRWMERTDVNEWHHLTIVGDVLQSKISNILKDCYCSSLVNNACDFCAGVRRVVTA